MGENPDARDANDEPIEIGARLKYLNTGDIGKSVRNHRR